jgi:5-methylcytosine-specific restriction endonuclease McrA
MSNGVVSYNKRVFIWERDKGCCWICGLAVTLEEMTLDHFVPKSKGGKNTVDNLRASHGECNNKRGNGDLRPMKRHNKRKPHKKVKNPLRGPVMDHITNQTVGRVLSTEERIALQKSTEP